MLASWVVEEVKDVNLKDKRLNDRMAQVLDQLGGHPGLSIPAACNGWADRCWPAGVGRLVLAGWCSAVPGGAKKHESW
jgi:hypothetical protein